MAIAAEGRAGVEEANPLTTGLERPPVAPASLVIFGATGDLSRRKLLPALYNLAHDGVLPGNFHVIGVARRERSDAEFADECLDAIRRFSRRQPDPEVLEVLRANIRYVAGTFDDASVYGRLSELLDGFEAEAGEELNRLFYLSTSPDFFPVIVKELGTAKLDHHDRVAVRVVIEKPFGTSLQEARELNATVLSIFEESQVFRIDHYLGKETVQNMLAFRFANGMFEPLWNRNYIDSVQITAAEDIGIGSRAEYYDHAGALRDLIQNHMLQLLCHVAMEPPASFTAEDVRNEKVKVLHAIPQPSPQDVLEMAVRAQYSAGHAGGEDVPGYLEEEGVPPDSHTETYAALRLEVDNWRWAGVPFYLRTGKRLARKITEIAVTLKPVPHLAFSQDGSLGVRPNQLVLTLQPNEGVSLSLGAKIPGTRMIIRPVKMEFQYGSSFLSQSPEAYERLIADVMRGDATLFTRNDEVEAQWRVCDPIVKTWGASSDPRAAVSGRLPGSGGGRHAAAGRRQLARDLMAVAEDAVWSAESTTPDEIEAALRRLLVEAHVHDDQVVPARVLNMIAFVDRAWTGEIANRLRGVGRYHASRMLVLSYEPRRRTLDARVTISTDCSSTPGELSLLRETVVVELGEVHLDDLLTIADPLVVTDLPTLLWSPHGHREVISELLPLSQAVLLDSVEEPAPAEALRWASHLGEQAYVVDLAWLRSTPWRERVAAIFDPRAVARNCARSPPSRSATTPPRPPPRCCSPAGWRRAWAGGKPRCWPTTGRCGAAPTPTARTSPCTCRPLPS